MKSLDDPTLCPFLMTRHRLVGRARRQPLSAGAPTKVTARGEASVAADLLWTWSYKGIEGTKCKGGSGTFVTTQQEGSGLPYYVVTTMMGTVEGNTITALLPPDSFTYKNDNKLASPSGAVFASPDHKVTGIGFLTNNDPATNANVNLLYAMFIDTLTGFYIQLTGPNGLALENIRFESKQSGEIAPAQPT
jgi:hypothetical protein